MDADASGAGDGSSWVDAFTTLQDALSVAVPGTQIWVAEGTYEPDRGVGYLAGDRAASFHLSAGVALYGGFSGTESSLPERDPVLHPTRLSGDLARDDQANWVNHAENAYHVLTGSGVDSTAILDGFVVYGGYAEQSSGWNGAAAGILLQNASPRIENCEFLENLAHLGAALGTFPGRPRVVGCRFEDNLAWAGRGGAAYHDSGSNVAYEDCRFVRNSAWGGSSVGDGGTIFSASATVIRLERCVFTANVSSATGPPYSNGGAICNLGDGMSLVDCAFYGNEAIEAGAIWTAGNTTLVNTVVSGNSSLFGGGLVVLMANVELMNCDITRNQADDGGGIAVGYGGTVAVRNSILWGNDAVNAPSRFKAQVHKSDSNATADFRYSDIEGVFTAEPGEDPPDPADFPGCTEADPLLADIDGSDNIAGTEDDDLSLLPYSPCIDAAENASVPLGILADLAGAPRFHDDPCSEDLGLGAPPLVDMGALEFPGSSCAGDVDEIADAVGRSLLRLQSVWPNPTRGDCRVRLALDRESPVRVSIHAADGRRVRILEPQTLDHGVHEIRWNGRDDRGGQVPAGIYFVRVRAGEMLRTRKLVVVSGVRESS